MQKLKNKKINAVASAACVALLTGCGPRQETPPAHVVTETTTERVPEKKSKTVIVQTAPESTARPTPKTKTETNVTVEVKPTPKPAPAATLPEPAPIPEATTKKTAPPSTPTAKTREASKPNPSPKPNPSTAPPNESVTKSMAGKSDADKPVSSKDLKVRVEVMATSQMPDPKSVPYKDALVFTKYKVLDVKSGDYKGKEILVAQWGMKDKKLQPAARQKVGTIQTLSLEPLSKRPDLESVMRSDDTDEYDLQPYFAE